MKKILALILLLAVSCLGQSHPFDYDLHLYCIPGKTSRTMVCLHGFGGNYKIAERLNRLKMIDATLISFNFPDHDAVEGKGDPAKITYGTIEELLPAFYVLKKTIIDEKRSAIDLYGYSAGGGAVVNLIAILNSTNYDAELERLGIGSYEKKKILGAIQRGIVILDTPLKSLEEIDDLKGETPELEFISKKYLNSHLRPIDSVECLEGLSLDVILHFQEPDEIVFNRDDPIFTKRLMEANKRGTTTVVLGNDGGHKAVHLSLWQFYTQKVQS